MKEHTQSLGKLKANLILIFHLTLKSALADISATKNARKQNAVTFEVFVLWLCNQHYYTRDA